MARGHQQARAAHLVPALRGLRRGEGRVRSGVAPAQQFAHRRALRQGNAPALPGAVNREQRRNEAKADQPRESGQNHRGVQRVRHIQKIEEPHPPAGGLQQPCGERRRQQEDQCLGQRARPVGGLHQQVKGAGGKHQAPVGKLSEEQPLREEEHRAQGHDFEQAHQQGNGHRRGRFDGHAQDAAREAATEVARVADVQHEQHRACDGQPCDDHARHFQHVLVPHGGRVGEAQAQHPQQPKDQACRDDDPADAQFLPNQRPDPAVHNPFLPLRPTPVWCD